MRKAAIFLCLLLSTTAQAQWFQATGSARVVDDNIQKARKQAITKAVKDTLLFSGVSIANLKQVTNGRFKGKQLTLSTGGEITGLQVLKEQQQGDTLIVNLRVDITPNAQKCVGYHYPKSIIVSRFAMNVPEQTVHGQIYSLHKDVSRILFNELSLNPYLFNLRNYVDTPLKLGEKFNDKTLPDSLRSLSVEKDSQFVVYGEINDLTINFSTKVPQRYFYLTIYLYDALQGHLVFSKQYRQHADWDYEITEHVNTTSRQFWATPYGEAIIATLDDVNIDIAQKLQCELPRARVITVDSEQLQINLGRRNGLKEGTIINLSYSSNFKDQFGIERSGSSLSDQPMKVIQVHENSAVLATLDNYPLSNIQIDDIALIKPQ